MTTLPTNASAPGERYNAAHQCDWLDGHLGDVKERTRGLQYDLLLAGSARGHGRLALAASQVPRCVLGGMHAAGTPAAALRDVAVAVCAALFDDGMVLPIWRLARLLEGTVGAGPAPVPPRRHPRRGRRLGPGDGEMPPPPAPAPTNAPPAVRPLQRLGDFFVLLTGLGGSLAAVPLNVCVVLANAAGAGVGLGLGLFAAAVALCAAPKNLTAALAPGLTTLVALTDALQILVSDQRRLPRGPADALEPKQIDAGLEIFADSAPQLAACRSRMARGRSWAAAAKPAAALERAMHQSPQVASVLGMPLVPRGRVGYMVAALKAHKNHQRSFAEAKRLADAESASDVFVDALESWPPQG